MPHALLGVVDKEGVRACAVLQGDVILHPVAARHAVAVAVCPEGGGDALRDTAGVGHHPHPAQIVQRLPRNGETGMAARLHPQGRAAHYLEVAGLVPVDLVNLFLFEEHRVAPIGKAPGKVPGAAHVHRVGIGAHSVEHIPVEGIAQLGGVDGVALAAPQAVLVLAQEVQLGHLPPDRQLLRVAALVDGEGVFIESQIVPINLPDDNGLVVALVGLCPGYGHRVPHLEDGIPVGPGGVDGVGLGLLFRVGAVLNLRAPAPARLQAAELPRQAVVIRLVGQDDDVGPQGGKLLAPVRNVALFLSPGVEARAVHPVQPVLCIQAVGLCQGLHQIPGPPCGEQRGEVAGQVLHVPKRPVSGGQPVVIASEAGLPILADAVGVYHIREHAHSSFASPPGSVSPDCWEAISSRARRSAIRQAATTSTASPRTGRAASKL